MPEELITIYATILATYKYVTFEYDEKIYRIYEQDSEEYPWEYDILDSTDYINSFILVDGGVFNGTTMDIIKELTGEHHVK